MISEASVKNQFLFLMDSLGFPRQNLISEKEMERFCPLFSSNLKRFDLLYCLSFEKRIIPLLLIECKTEKSARRKARKQVLNYNYFVQAPFVAVACANQFEVTSPHQKLREELAVLKGLSLATLCMGWPWWQGVPSYFSLQDLLKKHQKQWPSLA